MEITAWLRDLSLPKYQEVFLGNAINVEVLPYLTEADLQRMGPPTLFASLMARLDRLRPGKDIAQIGSAIGREFTYELLAAIATKPESELRSALEQLVGAGLIFARGTLPEATYLCKRALVRDVATGRCCAARARSCMPVSQMPLSGNFRKRWSRGPSCPPIT